MTWKVTSTGPSMPEGYTSYFDDVTTLALITVGISHHTDGTITLEYVED